MLGLGIGLGSLVRLQRGLGRERLELLHAWLGLRLGLGLGFGLGLGLGLGLELLHAVDGDDGLRAAARGGAAAVGAHGDRLALLGRDGEADLGEVGELLARRACAGVGVMILPL